MSRSQRYLAAGAAAVVTLPVLVLGLSAPPLLALAVATGLFAAIASLGARPVGLAFPQLKPPAAHEAAVREARSAIAALEEIWPALPPGALRERVMRIAAAAADIAGQVAADPAKLAIAGRCLTYYAPRAAAFAAALMELRARGLGEGERARAVEEALATLDRAFAHYASELAELDLAGLDTELRLVRQALRDDLG